MRGGHFEFFEKYFYKNYFLNFSKKNFQKKFFKKLKKVYVSNP
jgi:hypothetical protein